MKYDRQLIGLMAAIIYGSSYDEEAGGFMLSLEESLQKAEKLSDMMPDAELDEVQ